MAGAALGLTGALSGCGTAFGAGVAGTRLDPGTVTYWNLFGGGDGGRMQTMEAGYTQSHGGPSSVQAATFAWGNPYYTKLSLATCRDGRPT
jgi:multiple sugar transport system substrate-binding protein